MREAMRRHQNKIIIISKQKQSQVSESRMLQRIIDYEFATIQHRPPIQYSPSRSSPKTGRYNKFNILQTIKHIPDNHSHVLRWIGNDCNAHIMSFFYCLIMGCVGQGHEDMFIRVKYNLYELSEEFLGKNEQKVFVENMCVLQYAKNVESFLKKAKHFQDLIIKIFHSYRENIASNFTTALEPIQELKIYSDIFNFIQFTCYENRLVRISMPSCQFYIIGQNSCFFVSGKTFSERLPRINTEKITSLLMKERSKKKKKKKNKDREQMCQTPICPASPMSLLVESQYATPKFQIPSSHKKRNSLTSSENNDKSIREVDEIDSDFSQKRDVLIEEYRKSITEFSPMINKITIKRDEIFRKNRRKGLFEYLRKKKHENNSFSSIKESQMFPEKNKIQSQQLSSVLEKDQNEKTIGQRVRSQQKIEKVRKRNLQEKPLPLFMLKKQKYREKSLIPDKNSQNLMTVQESQPATPKKTLSPPSSNTHIQFLYPVQNRK